MEQVTQTIAMRYINKTKLIQYCVELWGTVAIQVCLNLSLLRSAKSAILTQIIGRGLCIPRHNPQRINKGMQIQPFYQNRALRSEKETHALIAQDELYALQ